MNERWFYAKDRKKCGPVTRDVIAAMLTHGDLLPGDMVLQEGSARWITASALLPRASHPREGGSSDNSIFGGPGANIYLPPPDGEAPPPGLPRRVGLALVNALLEVPRAVRAAFSQTGRVFAYWKTKRQTARLADVARQAQVELGERLVRGRLGDPALSRRVALLDERLVIVREARGPVAEVLRERAALLRQIAYPWLSSAAPAGLDAEHRRAVQATHTRTDQERTRDRARADLFPANQAGRARVAAGYALLVGAACLGLLLLLPSGRHPPRLEELFAQLAPAVPVVEVPGVGSGSGFLVRHDGRDLVVTNRHVIEHARNGIKVIFLRSAQAGKEEQLEVPANRANLVAIHRSVDLAVIDVSADSAALAKWGIKPVTLAPRDFTAPVGKHVFAIGHPGDASGGVLTRTLSDGIVSAVGRQYKAFPGTFTQVTVPINPGNSGGPIFDDNGNVVAVATFIIRKTLDKGLALEGLNFGLDVRFVHEILNDPSHSLSPKEIASLLERSKSPAPPPSGSPLLAEVDAKLRGLAKQGYRPFTGDLKTSVVPFRVAGDEQFPFALRGLRRGDQTAVFVVSRGSANVGLFVHDLLGRPIVESPGGRPDPMVAFRVLNPGDFQLRVLNGTGQTADGLMVLLLK